MKAVVYTRYGSPEVLQLKEVPTPLPADNEVLVSIHAVSINGSDREGLIGKPLYARIGGLFKPGEAILGSDIAGRVEKVGRQITQFKVGDEVFGEIPGYHGGFAEYACASEKTLAHKPAQMSYEEASAIPQGGVIALNGIREHGKVQPGQKVLINGAGGSAGMFAVQIAKLYGAEVTGVDHARKLDFIRSLGADHVMDYTQTDYTKGGKRFDLILDLIAHRSAFAYPRALAPGGTFFIVGGSVSTLFQVLIFGGWIKKRTGKNVRLLAVPQNNKDLLAVTELCVAGQIKPVIDKRFPLDQVPQAMRYVSEGHAKGKVVITVK